LSSPRPATQATSPEEILERAAKAYAAVRTMQADFRMAVTNPLLRRTTNSAGTLYQQRPDRIALRFSDPAGDAIVGDGTWFWVYYPSVNPDQVIRMPASEGTTGGVDLQAQFLGNPVERFDATLHGSERVGGRETHVLTMVPRTPAGYTSLKVWLDTSDSLARRFEITEENGTVRRFELTNLRTNVAIADDVFRFTPPAGARVIERS
jgi:outer membrane lipoprotein carrier protein